jgi:hypothetical protein
MSDGPDWVEQARRLVAVVGQSFGQPQHGPRGNDADHPADCRWCPVCQVAAVVRGERPEVTAALADVLGAAATALRDLADPAPDPAPAEPTPTQPPTAAEQHPVPTAVSVQHIEIA